MNDPKNIERVTFGDDIAALEDKLSCARNELEQLERRWKAYDFKTQETREALTNLRRTMRGEIPGADEHALETQIEQVDINPDSGRPSRGARRSQIEQICTKIGRAADSFRTVEVLNMLEDIEGDLTDGMKSYTYAVMTTLQDEGVVEKVGRGRWTLAD
jgi:molecular chaperone GrpE (heat shock protein)